MMNRELLHEKLWEDVIDIFYMFCNQWNVISLTNFVLKLLCLKRCVQACQTIETEIQDELQRMKMKFEWMCLVFLLVFFGVCF